MNDITLYLRSNGPTKKAQIEEELERDCTSELQKLLDNCKIERPRRGVYAYKKLGGGE